MVFSKEAPLFGFGNVGSVWLKPATAPAGLPSLFFNCAV